MTEQEYQILRQNMALANPVPDAKPKKRRIVTSEAEIERVCTQVLIHDGWRPLKTNPVSRRSRGAGFGELGMADYLYIRYDFIRQNAAIGRLEGMGFNDICSGETSAVRHAYADVLWIEFKREDGKPAEHQTRWHAEERAKGALTLIAGVDFPASVEGFMDWYAASGLKRTR